MQQDVDAYLQRLGLEAEPPSIEALQRLHRAHVATVPWETAWISLGQRWELDRDASLRRIAHTERGGYCFHMNGAFSLLLEQLGYDVTLHVGGVHGPDGLTAAAMANHLALLVGGLPTDRNPSGVWYADVGLGDAICEPLPLIADEYEHGRWQFTLAEVPSAEEVADWHFTHDAKGAFIGMAFQRPPATMADFAEQHVQLSTSPDSQFVKNVIIQRRDVDGVDFLRNAVLTRIDGNGPTSRSLTTRAEWFEAVADVFDVRFADLEPTAVEGLWTHVITTHETWQRTVADREAASGSVTRSHSSG